MLPKNLRYGSKVESASAKSLRSNIAPMNGTGTYGFNDTIIVNIPTRSNLVMVPTESYLKFNVAFTNGSTASNYLRWDSCGAHGIIQRIRIYHGSNLLQDIDNYGLLAKMLFDLQVPSDACYGKFNILAGTRNDVVTTLPTIAQANATDPANASYTVADQTSLAKLANELKTAISASRLSSVQVNSGDLVASNLGATTDSTQITYCLNLISLLGTLSSTNYIPLFACTSAPIRLEIQLVDSAVKCLSALTSVTAMKITNCEYVANMIELSDNAMGMIQSSLNGQPLQFVVPDYKNFQYTFALPATTSTQVNFPIPAKYSSLKSIFVTVRDQGTGGLTYYPFSTVKLGIQNYYFRVGSQLFPAKPPDTLPEMFAEVLKAIGSMSNLDHHPSIEKFAYTLDASQQNNTTAVNNASTSSGSFYLGLDLENYSNAPKDSIFAGYNSNTDDIYAVMTFASPNAVSACRFDAFALFDEVVVFENNTAYTRF
jgi:hypothetical protein